MSQWCDKCHTTHITGVCSAMPSFMPWSTDRTEVEILRARVSDLSARVYKLENAMNGALDCCARPDIATHDYKLVDGRGMVENRVCLKCGRHWHAGRIYTRFEWDEFIHGNRATVPHTDKAAQSSSDSGASR